MSVRHANLALLTLAASFAACDRRTPQIATTPPPPPPVESTYAAPEAPADPAPKAVTPADHREFLPSKHGFAFINSFKGSPLPPSLRPFQKWLGAAVPERFGLCGGMCAAAADYFFSETPIPETTDIPAEGDALYDYLYARQVDSFAGVSLPLRVAQAMTAPDTGPSGLEAATAKELPAIRRRLASGELVQLCIIFGKADGRTAPWDNHQVLAYADATTSDDAPTFRIYDPNYPKDDQATLTLSRTESGFSCTRLAHRRGKLSTAPVRGLFLATYSKRNPIAAPAPEKK